MEVVVTTVDINRAKLQSNHHPTFYRPDALPVAQPTVSNQSTGGNTMPLISPLMPVPQNTCME